MKKLFLVLSLIIGSFCGSVAAMECKKMDIAGTLSEQGGWGYDVVGDIETLLDKLFDDNYEYRYGVLANSPKYTLVDKLELTKFLILKTSIDTDSGDLRKLFTEVIKSNSKNDKFNNLNKNDSNEEKMYFLLNLVLLRRSSSARCKYDKLTTELFYGLFYEYYCDHFHNENDPKKTSKLNNILDEHNDYLKIITSDKSVKYWTNDFWNKVEKMKNSETESNKWFQNKKLWIGGGLSIAAIIAGSLICYYKFYKTN